MRNQERGPLDVQLALQGGGARLFALIAALEAVRELEDAGKVRVTRIAGTSAGAIAGGLYALGVKPSSMCEVLCGAEIKRITRLRGFAALFPTVMVATKRLLLGNPIADDAELRRLLLKMMEHAPPLPPSRQGGDETPAGGETQLRDVHRRIPLRIIATDTAGRRPVEYCSGRQPQHRLVDAMLDSSAIPFFFRAHRRDAGSLVLDGGLCDNLPTEYLDQTSTADELVAITFREQAKDTPRSLFDLASATLDVAISANIRRSLALDRVSVLELEPHGIGTFDFERALEVLKERTKDSTNPYADNRRRTKKFFTWLRDNSRGKTVGKDFWSSTPNVLMSRLNRVFASRISAQPVTTISRRFVIFADSLNDDGSADVVTQKIEFRADQHDVPYLRAQIGEVSSDVESAQIDVLSSGSSPVEFELLPIMSEDHAAVGVLLAFVPPLPCDPETRYFLQIDYRLKTAFPKLQDAAHEDEMAAASGPVGVPKLDLLLYVPEEAADSVEVTPRVGDGFVHPDIIDPLDIHEESLKVKGYRLHGYRGTKVSPQKRVGLVITRR